jgi:hypothetical protein
MITIHSRHFHVPSGRLYLHGSLPIDDDAVPGVLQSHAMMELGQVVCVMLLTVWAHSLGRFQVVHYAAAM